LFDPLAVDSAILKERQQEEDKEFQKVTYYLDITNKTNLNIASPASRRLFRTDTLLAFLPCEGRASI
jgi:hypothetical protein